MIIEHLGIEYIVSPLDGWHSRLYDKLFIDVFQMLAYGMGVREDTINDTIEKAPSTLLFACEYFVKFCLSTKANKGDFNRYNISQLNHIPAKYHKFLDLFFQDDFYERWLEAYLQENKEDVSEVNQKKEQIGE